MTSKYAMIFAPADMASTCSRLTTKPNMQGFEGRSIMPPSWMTLTEDEEILWWEHPSFYAHLSKYGLGITVAAVGILLAIGSFWIDMTIGPVSGGAIGIVIAVVGIGITAFEHLRRKSTHYILTTKHVYKKQGILSRDVDPVRLDQIADFEYSQSITDRLLKTGEVRIMTAGTGGKDLVLENVPTIQSFISRLSRQLDRQNHLQERM